MRGVRGLGNETSAILTVGTKHPRCAARLDRTRVRDECDRRRAKKRCTSGKRTEGGTTWAEGMHRVIRALVAAQAWPRRARSLTKAREKRLSVACARVHVRNLKQWRSPATLKSNVWNLRAAPRAYGTQYQCVVTPVGSAVLSHRTSASDCRLCQQRVLVLYKVHVRRELRSWTTVQHYNVTELSMERPPRGLGCAGAVISQWQSGRVGVRAQSSLRPSRRCVHGTV